MVAESLCGEIEGGGAKFVCAVGRSPLQIVDSVSIPTTDAAALCGVRAVLFRSGAAAWGAELDWLQLLPGRSSCAGSPRILATCCRRPKPGWAGVDVLAPLRTAFNVPLTLDTDVSAAAVAVSGNLARAEAWLGCIRDLSALASAEPSHRPMATRDA